MKITMNLPPKTVRLIKAVSALTGKDLNGVTDTLSGILDQGLKKIIADEVGIEGQQSVTTFNRDITATNMDSDPVISGLGDVDEEQEDQTGERDSPDSEIIEGLQEMDSMIPPSGGLTESDLEKDMEIDDPEKEAKGEPTPSKGAENSGGAEELFSSVLGLGSDNPYMDDRVAKRQKKFKGSRGRVTPFNGREEEASL